LLCHCPPIRPSAAIFTGESPFKEPLASLNFIIRPRRREKTAPLEFKNLHRLCLFPRVRSLVGAVPAPKYCERSRRRLFFSPVCWTSRASFSVFPGQKAGASRFARPRGETPPRAAGQLNFTPSFPPPPVPVLFAVGFLDRRRPDRESAVFQWFFILCMQTVILIFYLNMKSSAFSGMVSVFPFRPTPFVDSKPLPRRIHGFPATIL